MLLDAPAPPRRRLVLGRVLRHAVELALVVVLYRVYASLRNAQGAEQPEPGPTAVALRHGFDVLHLEQFLHLDLEHHAQGLALRLPLWFIRTADTYYADVHLPLTALVFVWLLLARRRRGLTAWRLALSIGTALSLAVFAVFPTMPPRLMPVDPPYITTLAVYGGLFGQAEPVFEHISHPYAAMPSLHLMWATWAGLALYRHARWKPLRVFGPVHIAATAVGVLVTGNHWVLDLVAGSLVFLVALAIAQTLDRLARRVLPSDRHDAARERPLARHAHAA